LKKALPSLIYLRNTVNYAKTSSTGAIHFAVSGCFSGCCYQLLSKIRVHSSTASSFEMFGQAPGKKRENLEQREFRNSGTKF